MHSLLASDRLSTADVDRCRIESAFNVSGVEFFDHLHAGAAVFSNLIDICAFHQAHADICVPQTVSCAGLFIAIDFKIGAGKDAVEQFDMIARKDRVSRLRKLWEGYR